LEDGLRDHRSTRYLENLEKVQRKLAKEISGSVGL